jgi:hypothetical protein
MSIHAYGMMNMLCSVVFLCNKHQEARKCKHRATVLSRSLEYDFWSSLMTEEHPHIRIPHAEITTWGFSQ